MQKKQALIWQLMYAACITHIWLHTPTESSNMKWNGSQRKEEGGGSTTIMTSLHGSGLLFSHGYSLNLQGQQKLSFNQCDQLQVYRTMIPCNGAPFAMQLPPVNCTSL